MIQKIFMLIVALALSACGTIKVSGESEKKNIKGDLLTLTPGFDGTAVTAAAIDYKEIDPATGESMDFKGYTDKGAPIGGWRRHMMIKENTPTGAKAIEAFVATGVPKFIEQHTVLKAADKSACKAGSVCPGGTVIQNNNSPVANAGASAENTATNGVAVDVGVKVNPPAAKPPCAETKSCVK